MARRRAEADFPAVGEALVAAGAAEVGNQMGICFPGLLALLINDLSLAFFSTTRSAGGVETALGIK